MSTAFPTAIDSFTNPTATSTRNSPSLATQQSDQNGALSAIETKLGTGASTPTASTVLRGTGTGTTAYGAVVLATDVGGTLGVANGGTGVTSSTGTGSVVLSTSPTISSPTLTTPTIGVATATSVNKVAITAPATSATLIVADGKTLTASATTTLATNAITLGGGEVITFSASNALSLLSSGTTIITFPAVTDTAAVLGTAQTFTATQTEKQIVFTNNAIAASSNAATVPITSRLNTVTNNSAATLTITMTTTSAVDGQMSIVRILDSSAAAQTITWVNTENSTIPAPTTSNGSTTLFLTVGFIYNSGTSKWRCIASA